MERYTCRLCGWNYDPERGDPSCAIAAGTSFAALPDGWQCPRCGATKQDFIALPSRRPQRG